jgi:hypothetical protein
MLQVEMTKNKPAFPKRGVSLCQRVDRIVITILIMTDDRAHALHVGDHNL